MKRPKILQLDISGIPSKWITHEHAACLCAKDRIAWSLGENGFRLFGGIQRTSNQQSFLDIDTIIAVKEEYGRKDKKYLFKVPSPQNRILFQRDHGMCAYCGVQFRYSDLTRDHIVPKRAGGKDTWMNLVTCCKSCNNRKADRMPTSAGMQLIYVPYVPCRSEWLILSNRKILADQMKFLLTKVPKDSRLHG